MSRESFYPDALRTRIETALEPLLRWTPDAVLVINASGLVVMGNEKFHDLFAYEADECRGVSAETFMPDLYSTTALGQRTHFLQSRDELEMGSGLDIKGKRKDGSIIWLELAATPYDVDKEQLVLLFARDISARKTAEERLVSAENRFRAIVEAAPDAMIISRRSGEIVMVNRAAKAMLGFSQLELVGMQVDDLVPEASRGRHDKLRDKFFDVPTDRRMGRGRMLYVRTREGRVLPVDIGLSPLRIGGEEYAVASLRDVTSQFDAMEAVKESEARAKSLVEHAPDAIAVIDVNSRRVIEANQSAADLYGYSLDTLVGMSTKDLRPEFQPNGEHSSASADKHYQAALNGEQPVFEWTGLTAGGEEIRCENRMLLLPGRDRAEMRVSSIDISDRIEMEAARKEAYELNSRREAAEKISQGKSEFIARMSHEIRTPMNGIMGLLEVLAYSSLDREQKELLKTVQGSADMMLQILDDILDFSKIEAGGLRFENIPVDIRAAAEHVGTVLGATAAEKGLDLLVYVDPEVPAKVLDDPLRMRQVLFNLVGNAVKFTDRGFVLLEISKVKGKGDNSVRYSISDSGIGIEQDNFEELFSPFAQAKASTTREFGGTGLGLAIVKNLVEYRGGRLKVDSVVGEGSTFSFVLDHDVPEFTKTAGTRNLLQDHRVLLVAREDEHSDVVTRLIMAHGGASELIVDGWSAKAILARLESAAGDGEAFTHLYLAQEVGRNRTKTIVDSLQGTASPPSVPQIIADTKFRDDTRQDASIIPISRTPLTPMTLLAALVKASDIGDVGGETVVLETLETAECPGVEDARRDGRLILLAEDNATNQMVIGRQLSLLGFAHEVADNGVMALSMFRKGKYGLLLTDINMPEMDGYDLAREIRHDEQAREAGISLPIIAVSAVAHLDEEGAGLPFGMDGYLSKPMKLERLKDTLDRWLPPQSEKSPATSHLRLEAVYELFGSESVDVAEILLDFQRSATECVVGIERDFLADDLKKLADGGHKLKSSARTIGADKLADICQSIENLASGGDCAQVENLVTTLKEEYAVLQDHIKRELERN